MWRNFRLLFAFFLPLLPPSPFPLLVHFPVEPQRKLFIELKTKQKQNRKTEKKAKDSNYKQRNTKFVVKVKRHKTKQHGKYVYYYV